MKAADTIEMEKPAAQSAKAGKSSASINLLSGIAGKAINMGWHDEAERILTNIVEALMSQAEQGTAPDEAVLTDTMTLTLQLAEASGKNVLLDIPFQIYGAYQRLIPSETIEDLYRLVGTTRYNNTRPIHSYIERLKDKGASLGANERFLLQRLEGLERRVASG